MRTRVWHLVTGILRELSLEATLLECQDTFQGAYSLQLVMPTGVSKELVVPSSLVRAALAQRPGGRERLGLLLRTHHGLMRSREIADTSRAVLAEADTTVGPRCPGCERSIALGAPVLFRDGVWHLDCASQAGA